MDAINIKQLAQKLNLSVSTVSKAFKNTYEINEKTRDRILAMAKELNYQPNAVASSLRTQKSKTIAVIIPEIDNSFFVQAIKGIESIAQELGYHVLIYLTHEDPAKEMSFLQNLQVGRADGVLMSLSGAGNINHIDSLNQKGLPCVFFDRIHESTEHIKITTNDFESGFNATQHLIDQGCKRIAHLSFSKKLSISKMRREGYLEALKKNKMKVDKNLLVECEHDSGEAFTLIKALLKSHQPDGVFSSFEKLAMQSYRACDELNLNIPEEVKIISFSNLEIASLLNPSLSTITQPAFSIGQKSAQILFELIDKKTIAIPGNRIVIPSTLMKRASTEVC